MHNVRGRSTKAGKPSVRKNRMSGSKQINSFNPKVASVIALSMFVLIMSPLMVVAQGNPGALWTNTGPCDNPQDVNSYNTGDHVYLHGDNFDAGNYSWDITKTGNGNNPVMSGTTIVDNSGAFCFDAYTIPATDDGEYQVKFGNKGDNYQVHAITPPPTPTATLIVKKVISGGTKTASDFSFIVNSAATATAFEADGENDLTVAPGTYTVTEVADAAYTTTYDNCTDVVLAADATATCTVTNTLIVTPPTPTATLIVKKVISGGTKTAADFSFSVSGISGTTAFEADGQNDLTLAPGTYTVTEVADAAYTTTYDNCTDVVLAADGSATCTITNTLIVVVEPPTGGGGGSTGGGGAPAPVVTPPGQVLGITLPEATPTPQVLGASTDLPRTGMPVGAVFLIILASLALVFSRVCHNSDINFM